MDFNQLNVFVYVYKTRSFSVAAKNLYLTQPTVSSHISNLENELKTTLFSRTTKQVIPTDDGEKLYNYAIKLIDERNKIIDEFMNKKNIYKVITFGSSTIPTNYIIPVYMNSFKAIHSNIKYNQITGNSTFLINCILKGSLNFAFVGNKIDTNEIEYIPFYRDRIVFITPNNEHYKKLIMGKQPIQTLLKEPIILRKDTKNENKTSTTFLNELGFENDNLNIIDYINDQKEIFEAVAEGKGISLFSKAAAQNYKKTGKILVYNPVLYPIRKNLYIAISKINKLSDLEKSFIQFVRNNN